MRLAKSDCTQTGFHDSRKRVSLFIELQRGVCSYLLVRRLWPPTSLKAQTLPHLKNTWHIPKHHSGPSLGQEEVTTASLLPNIHCPLKVMMEFVHSCHAKQSNWNQRILAELIDSMDIIHLWLVPKASFIIIFIPLLEKDDRRQNDCSEHSTALHFLKHSSTLQSFGIHQTTTQLCKLRSNSTVS